MSIPVLLFGKIAQQMGRLAKAFGMKVLAAGSRPTEEGRAIAEYVEMDELFAQSDVISLHCPLFPNTKGIICKENIAKMKDGVIIINSSRGPLIVEEDLAEALHISDRTVSKWERGESMPDVLTLVQLADVFDITVNDLLTDPNALPGDPGKLEKAMRAAKLAGIASTFLGSTGR